MASSATDPSSKIPQEIKDLFSWNPPRLYPLPSPSTSTRGPSSFDQHFPEELKLQRVVHLPSLIHDITAIVNEATDSFVNASGVHSPSHGFYSANEIERAVNFLDKDMADERAVAGFYARTTATFCAPVASTLALRNPGLLMWAQSANISDYAIAEGLLTFPGPTTLAGMDAELEAAMDQITLKHFRLLAERRTPLVVHAIMGGPEVMGAISSLSTSPRFDWTALEHDGSRVEVVGLGHDAKNAPWSFEEIALSAQLPDSRGYAPAPLTESPVEGVGTSKAMKRKRADSSTMSGSRRSERLAKTRPKTPKAAKKQKLDNVMQSLPPPPLGVQGKAVGKGKWKESVIRKAIGGNSEGSGPSYKDEHDLSAQCFVQKAWEQATRADCSIIVLHSGNDEFIGIRNRSTGTLYISDLIEPHACKEPSYGKLHVGIYIAAIKDAIDRASQEPDDGTKLKEGDDQRGEAAVRDAAAKSAVELASGRNVLLMYLQYGIYDSAAPSTFVRCGPMGEAIRRPSDETIRNYQLEECLTVVLTSEIGHGATGDVLRGTLEVEASSCDESLDVAVKIALSREQRRTLRNEYKMYCRLGSSGVTGITTPLGLFDDVDDGACALVMPYAGTPLDAMPEFDLPILRLYQKALLAALREIHHAGILHGDIRLDNILVADSGFKIIDFGHSQLCNDQSAKNREYSQLRSLLDKNAK